MSGLLFAGCLVAAVLAWFVLARQSGDGATRSAARAVLLLAPVTLFTSISGFAITTSAPGEYRVALEGVEFAIGAGDAVTIGGGESGDDADDLIVAGLPPGFMRIASAGGGATVSVEPQGHDGVEDPAYAVVRVDRAPMFANSVALDETSSPVLKVNGDGFPFDNPQRAVTTATSTRAMPARTQTIPGIELQVAIGRNLTPDVQMFPLRDWLRARDEDEAVQSASGSPLGSFLWWGPLGDSFASWTHYSRKRTHVTLVGDGTVVEHAVGVAEFQPVVTEIPQDGSRHLALFRVDYVDARLDATRRDRVQERRSFRATMTDGRLRIVFDTPDVIRLSPEGFRALGERTGDDFTLTLRDRRRSGPVVGDHMQLSFEQLGPRVQNEMYGVFRVNGETCEVSVTSHVGERCYEMGDAFPVGDRAAAILRVSEFSVPWGIALTLLALALPAAVWMHRHRNYGVALIIVSAAELLLTIRLLVAFEGSILDPRVSSGVWESLVCYALIPVTLRAAWSRQTNQGWVWLPAAVAGTLLIAIALVRADLSSEEVIVGAGTILAVPTTVALTAGPLLRSLEAWLRSRRLVWFVVLVLAARIGLWLGLGWKERTTPGNLALSVVYLPAALLFLAAVWNRYREWRPDERGAVRRTFGLVLSALVMVVIVPFLVNDSGSVLVYSPAAAALFALPWLAQASRRTVWLALPLVAVLLVHSLVLVLPGWSAWSEEDSTSTSYQQAMASPAAADAYFADRLEVSRNKMRVKELTAPNEVAQAGTAMAEGLVAQRRILDRFNGRGLLGAGYLNVPLSYFQDTHVNDNLSAIHVLAPFGWLGAAALILTLGTLAMLPLFVRARACMESGRTAPSDVIDQRTALGILALWTFVFASLYMISANVGLVLFTGRNVYLLAAASSSDALEGSVLLLLALVALAPAYEAPPASADSPPAVITTDGSETPS